ncbi:MAG: tetratricopeptide repeat protein [Helicobacteraceae bacterium]|jgi:tetratricopeptide (TPR) repeat protein|nr:tetratricopeptide repeat protein [Helicobacteraceae bacterium]
MRFLKALRKLIIKQRKDVLPNVKSQVPDELFGQAKNAERRGDFQAAINLYSQAIAIDPKDVNAYNNRGLAYIKLENYDQAIEDFAQAIALDSTIALDPEEVLYYNNRGNAHNGLQNYDQARKDGKKARDLGKREL